MSIVLADRVQEITTTTGTGTINLGGPVNQFQSFASGVGNGNQTYYCLLNDNNWEVGIGTVTAGSPNTLSRTTILASSNSGAAISLSGASIVFGDAPAALLGILANGTTGSGEIVLATSPTFASPTFTGTVAGAGAIPNSVLANSSVTVAGHTVSLGGSQTLAASDLTNGTTGSGNVVLGASPTLSGTVGGNLIWSGDQHFETGTPWVDVKAWGAAGNGSTNDSTAVQNAINHVSSSGGVVYFPAGTYALNSGITISGTVRLVGAGRYVSILTAGGSNTAPVVTMAAADATLEHLSVYGCGGNASDPFPASFPAVYIINNIDNARITDCEIRHGLYAVENLGADTYIADTIIYYPYGVASLYVTPGGQVWCERIQFDMQYPAGLEPGMIAGSTATIGTWSSGMSAKKGNMINIGGWLLQCTQTGTTGTVTPTPTNYFVNINDGTAIWQLCGSSSLAYVNLNSGENYFHYCDFSGFCVVAIEANGAGGSGVHAIIDSCIVTQSAYWGILLNGGDDIKVSNCELGGGWSNTVTSAAINIASTFSGGCSIHDNLINTGNSIGIYMNQLPSNSPAPYVIIKGNQVGGGGDAVFASANVSNFIIEGNNLGVAPSLSANNIAVSISSGTGDHFIIANNLVAAATTGISNAASGTHVTTTPNQ